MKKLWTFYCISPLKFELKLAIFTPQFLGFLGKTRQNFRKLSLNSKISPRHLKKKIKILTHIAKKLQARQFSQYCSSEKASGYNFYLLFPKKVLVFDLTFNFEFLCQKILDKTNDRNMNGYLPLDHSLLERYHL